MRVFTGLSVRVVDVRKNMLCARSRFGLDGSRLPERPTAAVVRKAIHWQPPQNWIGIVSATGGTGLVCKASEAARAPHNRGRSGSAMRKLFGSAYPTGNGVRGKVEA